jgi:hypothetical protein
MNVRITALSADIKHLELSNGDADEAVRQLSTFPWVEALNYMAQLEAAKVRDIISPEMTFTALPAHMTVQADKTFSFNVEVCLPPLKKLFGLFSGPAKFYIFKDVATDRVAQMIRQFCADDLERKHHYFAQLQANSL